MLPIDLFWSFVVATRIVFAVDIVQKRRKDIR
jgi:hypothetical protein